MGKELIILVFIFMACTIHAQTDTVTTAKPLKEAPASLKSLLNKIITEETQKTKNDAEIEIDGLLIEETKTKSGKDFYDQFYRDWIAPKNAKNYTIFITEKPYRLTTTMIEIQINETLVFQSFLQPRADIVEELAEQAVATTQIYLQNYEEIVRQLDGDDRSGTGIY
jgi:curli production assembly/transport component CsgE